MTTEAPALSRVGVRWWERPLSAAMVLFLLLTAAMFWTDASGVISTDVGGKLATLDAMDRRGDLSPDLGYWAEDLDPDGSLYPMWATYKAGDQWINATTFPMIYAALPLYRLGGARAAGLIPVAGAVVAALAARALSRRLGSDGTTAFWLVGAASPVTVYALDFWEHAPALGLMLWAVVHTLDASRGEGKWTSALAAGLLFGAASSMRQEAFLYGAVAGGALGIRLFSSRLILTGIGRGAAMVGGVAVPVLGTVALETWALGDYSRGARATGTAAAGGGDFVLRVEEAIVTGASPFAQATFPNLAVGILLAIVLFMMGRRADEPDAVRPLAMAAGAVAALWVFDTIRDGLGFVPGLAATTPLAVMAIGRMRGSTDRLLLSAIAIIPLPLVWVFGFTGGAGPQWGGRYILLTGAVLLAAAPSLFDSEVVRPLFHRMLVASALITFAGVAFAVVRTHATADALREIADRDEEVVVFYNAHRPREAGAFFHGQPWLAAHTDDELEEVGELLLDYDVSRFAMVGGWEDDEPPKVPGWEMVEDDMVLLMGRLPVLIAVMEPIH